LPTNNASIKCDTLTHGWGVASETWGFHLLIGGGGGDRCEFRERAPLSNQSLSVFLDHALDNRKNPSGSHSNCCWARVPTGGRRELFRAAAH